MKKQLNKNSILYATLHLIDSNGTTTTMEVKNRLRAEGFYAKQKEVSDVMMGFVDSTGLHFTDNGKFRTYSFENQDNVMMGFVMCANVDDFFSKMSNPVQLASPTVKTIKTAPTSTSDTEIELLRGNIVTMTTTPVAGDYCVAHNGNVKYFRSAGVNSNQAKSAYAKVVGGLKREDVQSVSRV